jgi:hypothetical protein
VLQLADQHGGEKGDGDGDGDGGDQDEGPTGVSGGGT